MKTVDQEDNGGNSSLKDSLLQLLRKLGLNRNKKTCSVRRFALVGLVAHSLHSHP